MAVRPRSATVRGRSPMIRPLTTLGLGAALAALALPIPSAGAGEAPPTSPPTQQAGQATVFTFTGRGWGHGVGMSQYGARGRALAGWSGAQILRAYYPGTALKVVHQRPVRVLLSAGRRSATVWSPVAWRPSAPRQRPRPHPPARRRHLPHHHAARRPPGADAGRPAGGGLHGPAARPGAHRRRVGRLGPHAAGGGAALPRRPAGGAHGRGVRSGERGGPGHLCPGGRAAGDARPVGRRRLRGPGRPGRGHAQLRARDHVPDGRLRRLRRRPQPGLRRGLRGGPPHHPGRHRHPGHGRDVPWRRHHDLLLLDLRRAHRRRPERLPRRDAASLPGERGRSLRSDLPVPRRPIHPASPRRAWAGASDRWPGRGRDRPAPRGLASRHRRADHDGVGHPDHPLGPHHALRAGSAGHVVHGHRTAAPGGRGRPPGGG